MKKYIAFLLSVAIMASVFTVGMGTVAFADAEEAEIPLINNVIVTAAEEEKSEEKDEPEKIEAEDKADPEKAADADEKTAGEEKSAEEVGKDEDKAEFDLRLAGEWFCYSEEMPDYSDRVQFFEDIGDLYGFGYNGEVDTVRLDYPSMIAKTGKALLVNTQNGQMDYFEKLCELTEKQPELFADEKYAEYAEELKNCSNVKVSYKFFDFRESGDGETKPSYNKELYRESKEDGLIIRIEADVQLSPLERKHQVYEYKYYKKFNFNSMGEWSLLGKWEDSMGNTWEIAPYLPEEATASAKLICVLKDAGGKEYVSKNLFWKYERDGKFNVNGFIDISFKDISGVMHYKVESVDHNKLSLSSENGDLVMTRIAEPYSTKGMSMPE